MPTAAAVAAAAATAKIQALDAVASNAVLGLSAATPSLGISSLTAAKVAALPLTTTGNTLHPTIAIPTAAGAAFITAGMFQPPGMPTNILTASALQAVTAPSINSVTNPLTVSTSTTAGPIIGKLKEELSDGIPAATAPNPIASFVSNNATIAIPNLTTTQSDHIKKEKQLEDIQKKLIEEGETQTLQQQENMSIKGQTARQFVMQRLMRPQESRVIILRNMVGPEDVDETLQEEIQEECTKFGTVSRVIIFNEKQTENEDDDEAEIIVKIFVEFSTTVEAVRGKEALHGRFFGGRRVIAELYDQSLFDHGDLSG